MNKPTLNRVGRWPGLTGRDFACISQEGFGDGHNAYAHSMAFFQGRLYVGTTRGNIPLMKKRGGGIDLAVWPVVCPPDPFDLDLAAEVWCFEPRDGSWTRVFKSPTIVGSRGTTIPREFGYRGMTVFTPAGGRAPILVLGTWSPADGPGCLLLASADGTTFEPVCRPGLNGLPVTVIRSIIQVNDRLYTTPAGARAGQSNASGHAVIYESSDPTAGAWEPVSEVGFGDPGNEGIFEMAVLGEYLYAGTFNLSGYQVWRTIPKGPKPYRWERVITQGAYRGPENQIPASMHPFKGALYIGGAIQGGGIDRKNKVGPAAAELIRIRADNSWDVLIGEDRDTPEGRKQALSGWGPGFDNFFNGYFWRMCAHDGWLYLSTYNWSIFLAYANRASWPEPLCDIVNSLGPAFFVENGGAALFRSFDGETWVNVTDDGFENGFNIGVREMVSTPEGLFVSTANPFGPILNPPDGKKPIHNDRGGCEVFLGRRNRSR